MMQLTDQQCEFDQLRPYLMGLAYRMLGSRADAEDAVQETWLRWQKQTEAPHNAKAWLTRVCSNICIDALRRLKRERLSYEGPWLPEPVRQATGIIGTSELGQEALTESLQLAYMLLLERLTPAERAALLLHDVFGYDFREVADILQTNTAAARQHASRARKHLKASKTRFDAPDKELEKLGTRLYAALSDGDIDGIISYLAADVELWSDGGGKALAARNVVSGPDRVAAFLHGIFRKAPPDFQLKPGLANGKPAMLLFNENGQLDAILTITCNELVQIGHVLAHRNPDKLSLVKKDILLV